MRLLSNMNNKFYYYCPFYLLFFEESTAFYISRRIEKRHEYLEARLNNYVDFKTFELFFFDWRNHIDSRF